jgi:hypothetical protein
MAEPLTSMQAQILDKNKAAVEALLGEPVKKRFWKNAEPPQNADAAALAAFRASMLDEIWIYSNGRVHFTLDGIAKKVDDKVRLDIPPANNLVA